MNTYQPKRMDNQHRATDTEWYSVKARAFDGSNVSFSCILELLHRIEALEAAATTAQPNHPAKPDSSLVERVAAQIENDTACDLDPNRIAGSVIRLVAAWLREERPSLPGKHGSIFAYMLEKEAAR